MTDHFDGGYFQVLPPHELVRGARQAIPPRRSFRNRQICVHQGSAQPEVGQGQVCVRDSLLHEQHDANPVSGDHHEQA